MPKWTGSPEVSVMLHPEEAYRLLEKQGGRGIWLALKRPLLFVFVIACMVSLVTSPGLTLRLVGPSIIFWSFIPVIEIGSLIAVCWSARQSISLPRMIDLFFMGHGPWSIWLIGMAAVWSLLSPATNALDFKISLVWRDGGFVAATLWSAYIDFWFFQTVLGRNAARARRDLILQRVISWGLIIPIMGAPTAWSEIAGRLVP
jgi:hypothetical protein